MPSLVEPDASEGHWWRGCKENVNKTIGCSEHKWYHNDQEYLVDECVCDTRLCNEHMDPIPDKTTSTIKTTTDDRMNIFDLLLYHALLVSI